MKRSKGIRILVLVLVFAVVLSTMSVLAASGSTTVYITRTGSKYHYGWCSYLHSSKIATTLSSALASGYTPCSRCDPPSYVSYARWVQRGDNWYYLDANDNETTGWKKLSGSWYYFNYSGQMATGLQTIGEKQYYFDGSGAMVTGWKELAGNWYYFTDEGAVVGWKKLSGDWYYFDADGKMTEGWETIEGEKYYFEDGGAMVTGWEELAGDWYYLTDNGAAVGWKDIGGTRYYFDQNGKMAKGWATIEGEDYYFLDGGAMVTGELEIDSITYSFDDDGALLMPERKNTEQLEEGSTFEIHFIDVGQADAALVLCDDQAMLIDGGNAEDSDLIYAYLEIHGIEYLDYIVATHGHEDHVGGLSGALNYAEVGTAYCSVTEYDSEAFEDFVKYLEQQDVEITIPAAGDSFELGTAAVEVLGPIHETDDANNMSLVLRVVYGDTSFLFTGDAEREEEQDILDAGYDLASTVLKVGHHGSENSTTYPFLREIMPAYAVISVGENNSYGHPTEAALSRLSDADVAVYRTDIHGTIICTSDGETVSFMTEKEAAVEEENVSLAQRLWDLMG